MSPQELAAVVDAVPFEPFRIVLSSGNSYDVDAPHRVIVGNRFVHLAFPASPGDRLAERVVRLDLLHVTEVIPLTGSVPPQQGNGHKAG